MDNEMILRIARTIDNECAWAGALFEELAEESRDGAGITRDAYGAGEQAAYKLLRDKALALGLEVANDNAGNLYATLAGADRALPAIVIGSHLDSVPRGGNYDGAAGVVAGLLIATALRRLGLQTRHDIRVMGIRCEESPWFGAAYIGSRLALGLLPPAELDRLKRFDTRRSLAQHIDDLGFDSAALREGGPALGPETVAAYFELHIEQGPILVGAGLPLAVGTAIRGNARYPFARCLGAYAHSAAVPRGFRSDAVLATAELAMRLEAFWRELEATGSEGVVLTIGQFSTDPELHAMTKVPGEVRFTLNFGSTSVEDLSRFDETVAELAEEIGERRRVRFELGEGVGTPPTALDADLRQELRHACRTLGHQDREIATVGHDAGMFMRTGIPAGMVLVRNEHGSHNAEEAMALEDFAEGCKVLALAVARRSLRA